MEEDVWPFRRLDVTPSGSECTLKNTREDACFEKEIYHDHLE